MKRNIEKQNRACEVLYQKDIQEIVEKSEKILFRQGMIKSLKYQDFVWTQVKQIKKIWWILQFALLLGVGWILRSGQDMYYVQRSLGIAGALFVIFMIPEFWKNDRNKCMEIEMSCYYSLRQIYATRLLMFGVVDILMLTLLSFMVCFFYKTSVTDIAIQFLFPMTITACICFKTLEKQYVFHSTGTTLLCLLWSAVWWRITTVDFLYQKIIVPLWICFILLAVCLLGITIKHFVEHCENYWEESYGSHI